MRSTYSRAMTGGRVGAAPIKKRTVYVLTAVLIAGAVALRPDIAAEMVVHPVGIAAMVAIIAGFITRWSMALIPWLFVCGALVLFAVGRVDEGSASIVAAGQIALVAGAILVSFFQLRYTPTGSESRRPTRTRWGSVLVASTMFVLAGMSHLSTLPLVGWQKEGGSGNKRVLGPVSYSDPVLVGRIKDPRITESSGLAASVENEGSLWTHNDSGDAPVVYCIAPDGSSCGSFHLSGAVANDWEGMSVGPGPRPGQSYLYVGDIGGNIPSDDSEAVTVYRVPEPSIEDVSATAGAEPVVLESVEEIMLRYPDGPHDAESLLVHPSSGDLYIITKEVDSGVYKAEGPLAAGTEIVLDRVARFSIFANLSDRTGGSISPNGRRVVFSTYGGAYEFVLPTDFPATRFDAIWRQEPRRIRMGLLIQSEAITYRRDGRAIFATSEGRRSPIYRVDLRPKR